jgi:hypothetical protein
MPMRERGKCDRSDAWCHCSACPGHCPHVCVENGGECCLVPAEMQASCPFCGERAEGCECHKSTHGG